MERTGSARRPLFARASARGTSRTIALAAALLLGLGAPGCKKSSDTAAPGSGDSTGAAKDPASAGVTLRYKIAARSLKKSIQGGFTVSSNRGGGSVTADLSGQIDFIDNGDGTLKASYKVTELRDYKSEMPQQPGAAEAGPPPDPKEIAKTVTGAAIINDRGEPDEEKTKALPENKRDENMDPQVASVIGIVEGMMSVPELPEEALEVGKAVTKSEEKEIPSPIGMKIPSEIDTTIKLVSVDDSSGARIATIEIEVEGSGAVEQGQMGMISMDSSVTQTLVFNLDEQLPVSAKVQSTNAYTIGTQGSLEMSFNYEASFEPG